MRAAHTRNRVQAPRRSAPPHARRRADRAAQQATAARSAGSLAHRPARRAPTSRRVTSSTNSGTPPVRSLTPSTTSLRQRVMGGESRRPCVATSVRSSGDERNRRMVRTHAPGRAKFRPRRRDDEQRRLRAALGQRVHEVERRRIGPMQVLEGEHDRLRPRPRQNQAVIAASCRRRNSSGANFAARSSGSGISTSGASSVAYSAGSRPTRRSVVSRSASRCSAATSAAEALAGPIRRLDAAACSAKAATTIHSTQVCGVSPSREWNSSISRDLPRPGSPTISDELALAGADAVPATGAAQGPPRGRRRALAPARRPFGRRRWRERLDKATAASGDALQLVRALAPRRRRARRPGAARFP